MKKLLFFSIAALLFFTQKSFSQPTYSYGINPYYGAVFRYKQDMPILKFTNLHGVELFFHKQTDGLRYWESKYNYPRLGLSAGYYNYGEPEELGNVYLLSGYLDFTFAKTKVNHWRMNLGTGLVYSDVIYDSKTNPENKAIGASVSYILRGTVYYHQKINPHWALNLNMAFRHFSNGRTNMPNNGMNFPIIGVGVEYSPSEVVDFKYPEVQEYNKKIHLNIFAATAWREVLADDYKHKAHTVSAFLNKRVSWYNSLLVGIDGFYYSKESIRRHLAVDGVILEKAEIDGRQIAITVGNELYFGRVSLVMQAGVYVYDPHKVWSVWYQRYGLKYSVVKDAYLQVSLKSHTRTANMIEWGVGLSL